MKAGSLDRRITIQRKVVAQNNFGEEVTTWQDVATVWAEKIDNTGQERFQSSQFIGKTSRSFRFRWSNAVKEVTTEHQIVFDGVDHDIVAVHEINRREGIFVDCTARSELPMINA